MTDEEKKITSEIIQLLKNLNEHSYVFEKKSKIQPIEIDAIANKVKTLFEKLVVLKYLNQNTEPVIDNFSVSDKRTPENTEALSDVPMPETGGEINTLIEEDFSGTNVQPQIQAEEKSSLNEKFGKNKITKTIASELTKQSLQNLKNSIGVNERILFQKELFNNDKDSFNKCLDELERHSSINESQSYLNNNYKWDENNATVKRFYNLIEKRFVS
jgi:hypothetical protein